MAGNSGNGADVICDAAAQEIDGGEAQALVAEKKADESPKAKGTRSCIIEGDTGGGIALGTKPITNSDNASPSAEMRSHNEGAANGSTPESADQGADVGGNPFNVKAAPGASHQPRLAGDPDWRSFKPRRYGQCLPPVAPSERQNIKTSIVTRGFFGRILIDEWLNVIDGNTRWDICCEVGVCPEVEMIKGLSEEEKEELAISWNLDRRHLKDPDTEQKVREARLENLFQLREHDPKTWSQEKIAAMIGVSDTVVSLRERLRHNSRGGNMSKPDGRRKYNKELEREAVRLVKQGDSYAEAARKTLMHPKAVERAVKDDKAREAGTDRAKQVKKAKSLVDSCARQVAKAPDGGIPELHRLALEHLGTESEDYVARCSTAYAQARKDLEANSNDVNALLGFALYGSQLTAAAEKHLEKLLGTVGGGSVGGGTVQEGTVIRNEPDRVYVELDDGRTGVVRKSEIDLMMYGSFEFGVRRRFRETGHDAEDGSLDLQPLGQQTPYRATDGITAKTDLDERWSPFGEVASLKAGPKKKRMSK